MVQQLMRGLLPGHGSMLDAQRKVHPCNIWLVVVGDIPAESNLIKKNGGVALL
jgi:hypothetical protein